jgi:signal transduction histidine kinase
MATTPDLDAFHEELRRKNLAILAWSAIVFNVAYVAWTVFDHVLAPAHATEFLVYRLSAAAINTGIVLVVHRTSLRRRTWEAFWLWLFVFGALIAPMLPQVGDEFAPYVLGFTLIIFGAGLLPFWPARWAASLCAAVVAVAIAALAASPGVAGRDLVAGASFVATAVGLALVMAWYKYDFSKRDYFTRAELAAAVERETEARLELSRTGDDLARALARLRQLDERKNTFFANVSHELRTPLTLILAPVEEMQARAADPAQARPLALIRRNAERLLRLIDDLLDLSRLDVGGLRLDLADLDVRAIVQTVVENGAPAAAARKIELVYDADESQRPIHADAHRLEIILTNLVGNALKYTPDGGHVAIKVRDGADAVTIDVADDGPGIPAADLPRVFDRFYQAGRADRRAGGVGIGLSLARELADLHGGDLSVVSTEGRGTTFTLRLPFGKDHIRPEAIERRKRLDPARRTRRAGDRPTGAPPIPVEATPGPAPVPAPRSGRRARIVVAEDNEELRRFIVELLEVEHEVIATRDGEEALAQVREARPDLVVSDVMMPKRSGAELCSTIKLDPELRSIPVILLTARVGSEATLEGYAHGADDFVAKPFHPRVLLARCHAQLRLRHLAAQLAERERMAAIGSLAAGVLHEVRNPVNAILNAARVLGGGVAAEKAARMTDVIAEAASRIQAITVALEEHARPADGGDAPARPREGLEATLRLLEHRLDGVQVHRDYAGDPIVDAPAGPLNQVLMNLLDNALAAGAKNLWVGVGVVDGDGRIRVVVEDDGGGVPPPLRERLFDPFVSGRGSSGLGLYVSRRIVEEHAGILLYEARTEGGSRFAVELPAAPP